MVSIDIWKQNITSDSSIEYQVSSQGTLHLPTECAKDCGPHKRTRLYSLWGLQYLAHCVSLSWVLEFLGVFLLIIPYFNVNELFNFDLENHIRYTKFDNNFEEIQPSSVLYIRPGQWHFLTCFIRFRLIIH